MRNDFAEWFWHNIKGVNSKLVFFPESEQPSFDNITNANKGERPKTEICFPFPTFYWIFGGCQQRWETETVKTEICFPFSIFNDDYLEVVKMFPQLPKPPVLCCWTEQESMEEVRTKHGCTRYVDMDMDIRDMWIQKTNLFCNYGYAICGYKRPIYSAIVDTRYVFGICSQFFLRNFWL